VSRKSTSVFVPLPFLIHRLPPRGGLLRGRDRDRGPVHVTLLLPLLLLLILRQWCLWRGGGGGAGGLGARDGGREVQGVGILDGERRRRQGDEGRGDDWLLLLLLRVLLWWGWGWYWYRRTAERLFAGGEGGGGHL